VIFGEKMFKKTQIAIATTFLAIGALYLYNAMFPTREIGRGSFRDSKTAEDYEYVLFDKGHDRNSKVLSAWPKGSFPIIAPILLTDSNLDGLVGSQGIFNIWQRSHVAQAFVDGQIGIETDVGSTQNPIRCFTEYKFIDGAWTSVTETACPDHKKVLPTKGEEARALDVLTLLLIAQAPLIAQNQLDYGLPYRPSRN
jgi:hypothetical protein